MDQYYQGVVWTNHALEKLRERNIKQGDAWAAFNRPDSSKYSREKGAWVYQRNVNNRKVFVVAKKNKERKWLIISAWSKNTGDKNSGNIFVRLFKKYILGKPSNH